MEQVKESKINNLHVIAFWGLSVLLFFPPFFQGLYFAPGQQRGLFFAVLVFWLVWIWKRACKDHSFISHPLDYFMLAFPLIYILASFNAVNYGLAVDEIVKGTLYFMGYWCVVQLARSRKDAERLLYVIYTGTLGVALAGLMSATGLIDIKDGFVDGRIYSTLQYPNTLAAYMVAVFAIGIYFWWGNTFNGIKKANNISYLFAAGNYILVAVMAGAKSNGGLIVFALAMLMLVAFFPGRGRFSVFMHIIKITVPAGVAMYFFSKNVAAGHNGQAWLWILFGVLLVVLIQWLYFRIIPAASSKENWMRPSVIAGATVIVLLAGILAYAGAEKVTAVTGNLKVHNLMHRVYFIEDAIKMIKDRPLLGWGGGGWEEAYSSYQSYSYKSKEVHSHYIQTGVETGITGILVLAGMWFAFLYAGHRAFRKHQETESRVYILILTVAAVALGVHAAADFDLSLSALSLVLYTFMALVRNMDGDKKFIKVAPVTAMASGLIVIILVSCLMAAQGKARQATVIANRGNLQKAISAMEKSVRYDPFRADYHTTLADFYKRAGREEKALDEAWKAMDRSKYQPSLRTHLSNLALGSGSFDEAVKYAEEAISLAPWQIHYYEFAAMTYKSAGMAEMKNNRPGKAVEYFTAVLQLPDRIQDQKGSLDSFRQKYSTNFTVTPKISQDVGVSQINLNYLKEASESYNMIL